jgi:hypothetical protein
MHFTYNEFLSETKEMKKKVKNVFHKRDIWDLN